LAAVAVFKRHKHNICIANPGAAAFSPFRSKAGDTEVRPFSQWFDTSLTQ
jgi:hypothetical protein